jgi:flagellar P-ring protein precursor FlgI
MRRLTAILAVPSLLMATIPSLANPVALTGLGRFSGWRENALIGYGLVTGLAGSGDTRQSAVTRQSLRSVLSRLGTSVTDDQISSRNVAVVLVTAVLPASANIGDRIDVNVSSVGDARSLAGGTLIMTPLLGPDQRPYALAQGQLLVGGYHFESNFNEQQRNFPTAAVLPGGATIEASVDAALLQQDGAVTFFLTEPSFGTAQKIADAVNRRLGMGTAWAGSADEVRIRYAGDRSRLNGFLADISGITVEPDIAPRVIVNERTGTVVAGGDVIISSVVIAQGDLKVTIKSEQVASQPGFIGGFANDVRSLVVTNTKLDVEQGASDATLSFPNTTVADLVLGLHRAHVDTRRMISILQAVKSAGALHADILVK